MSVLKTVANERKETSASNKSKAWYKIDNSDTSQNNPDLPDGISTRLVFASNSIISQNCGRQENGLNAPNIHIAIEEEITNRVFLIDLCIGLKYK